MAALTKKKASKATTPSSSSSSSGPSSSSKSSGRAKHLPIPSSSSSTTTTTTTTTTSSLQPEPLPDLPPPSFSGGPLTQLSPLYDAESDRILVSCLNAVRVYNMSNAEYLHSIPTNPSPVFKMAQHITAMLIHPSDPNILITGTRAGSLRVHRISDASLLSESSIQGEIRALLPHPSLPSSILIASSTPKSKANYAVVYHKHITSPSSSSSSSSSSSVAEVLRQQEHLEKAHQEEDVDMIDDSPSSNPIPSKRSALLAYLKTDPPPIGGIYSWDLPCSEGSLEKDASSTSPSSLATLVAPFSQAILSPLLPLLLLTDPFGGVPRLSTPISNSTDPIRFKRLPIKLYKSIECVAFHPLEPILAIGDSVGRIDLWYNALPHSLSSSTSPTTTPPVRQTLHWHAFGVNCLAFSPDGSLLLSGGQEGVLVSWQLRAQDRSFLPRLGASLSHLSIVSSPGRGDVVVVAQEDNTIRLVSLTEMRITRSLVGLARAGIPPSVDDIPVRPANFLLRDPSSSDHLILPSSVHPGTLQLWQGPRSSHLASLHILPPSPVGRNKEGSPVSGKVRDAVFSATGTWLIAVEERSGGSVRYEQSLSFWSRSPVPTQALAVRKGKRGPKSLPPFQCITRVEHPHQGEASESKDPARITALASSPSTVGTARVATGGSDGRIRIWNHLPPSENAKDQKVGSGSWICHAILSPPSTSAQEPCGALAFSPDGSVLAAAFGGFVTLWDPEQGKLKSIIPMPEGKEESSSSSSSSSNVISLRFIEEEDLTRSGDQTGTNHRQVFLYILTRRLLLCWNVLQGREWWGLSVLVPTIPLKDHDHPSMTAQEGQWMVPMGGRSGCLALMHLLGDRRHITAFRGSQGPVPLGMCSVGGDAMALESSSSSPNTVWVLSSRGLSRWHVIAETEDQAWATEPSQPMDKAQEAPLSNKGPGRLGNLVGHRSKGSLGANDSKDGYCGGASNGLDDRTRRDILPLLDTPAHLAPGVQRVFGQFMHHLLHMDQALVEKEERKNDYIVGTDEDEVMAEAISVKEAIPAREKQEEIAVRSEEIDRFRQAFHNNP
ncbi:MAG: WD40-repeat-containing domain protein [Piptocephalis tieghemiana]|nr:MAG: WD40-repeat-containing domain protein [Piptocephalis tieghemiana]